MSIYHFLVRIDEEMKKNKKKSQSNEKASKKMQRKSNRQNWKDENLILCDYYLCSIVLEYWMKPLPAILVEEESKNNLWNGEGCCNCRSFKSEDTNGYYLCQHQRKDCGVMHYRPKLAPTLIFRDIHIENLKSISRRMCNYLHLNIM